MYPPQLSHIKETCLYVKDLEISRKFYEDILGLKRIHYQPDAHLFLKIGQDVLLLFNPNLSKEQKTPPSHYGSGELHIAFECSMEDYENWKTYLIEKEISIEFENDWPKGGKSLYFRDPDNLCLEIVQPGIWGF
ncbi:MAG TPA: VOC family protein [Chitinophagales bacterium]|nr:VOC family protein [Chitinophagales bacterium]